VVSVVVVAADSGPLLQACVDAVLGSPAADELLLVDNHSRDGEVDRAVARHAGEPRLRVLRNTANLGFGPACNRGAAAASGDVLVFLNPDCIVPEGTLAAMAAALHADGTLGLLGACVCDPRGHPARGNRRRDPTLRRALMALTGLARFESRWPMLAGIEMPAASEAFPSRAAATDEAAALEDVEAVSGACMALSRSAFERVHGFDEAYFLHVEDLDLCRRIRDAGLRVAIAPALRVIHAQGSSSHHRPVFVAWHKHRGMWRWFTRFDPAARNLLLRSLVWLGLWSRFALMLPLLALPRRRPGRASP
jgi:GT2 family glycosyltransferase